MSRTTAEACAAARHAQSSASQTIPPRQPRERIVPLLAECDVCGSADLLEIKCKVICGNCRTILQSCADL